MGKAARRVHDDRRDAAQEKEGASRGANIQNGEIFVLAVRAAVAASPISAMTQRKT